MVRFDSIGTRPEKIIHFTEPFFYGNMMETNSQHVVKLPHHEKMEVCTSRPNYRQGRKFTAVKVYTINNESQHLVVSGVPALGLQDELMKLCSKYGEVRSLVFIPQYEQEDFTEAYHVQYSRIQSARFAKRLLDEKSYFGGVLHVCYAPEMESVDETRAKLIQRRRDVARHSGKASCSSETKPAFKQFHRKKKHPALPLSAERLSLASNSGCIWNGIPREIDPRVQAVNATQQNAIVYGPARPDKKWLEAGVKERKLIPRSSLASAGPSSQTFPATKIRKLESQESSPKVQKTFMSSPILKFVPRQVKIKRIVFRNSDSKKNDSSKAAADDLSVEETILSVRRKIREATLAQLRKREDNSNEAQC